MLEPFFRALNPGPKIQPKKLDIYFDIFIMYEYSKICKSCKQ